MKELVIFTQEKRRLKGDLTTVFQCLQGSYKEDRGSPQGEKTRDNGYNLHQERFHLDIRKKFLTARTLTHQKNLPRDVVESQSLEVFKVHLDRVQGNLTQAPFPHESLDLMTFPGPSQLGLPYGSGIL